MFGLLLTLVMMAAATLIPAVRVQASVILSGASQRSLDFIVDGTSNTIQFRDDAEPTRITFCFDHVTSEAISDGTSNTIQFGEGARFVVAGGSPGPRREIETINDGSSNTILFGEYSPTDFCFADVTVPFDQILDGTSNTIQFRENSTFDVCFDNVRRGTISDGTSNTIAFGEWESSFCYVGAVVEIAASVTEPGALSIIVAGLLGIARARRQLVRTKTSRMVA